MGKTEKPLARDTIAIAGRGLDKASLFWSLDRISSGSSAKVRLLVFS
jgi:hypothetical protein